MSSSFNISMAHLDELVQAAKAYLDATITKCDSPDIRQARTNLVKAIVIPNLELDAIKKSIKIDVTTH